MFWKRNLVWAPNKAHTGENLKEVLDALKQADQAFGTPEAIMDTVEELGKVVARR